MQARAYYPQARAILQVVLDGFGSTARDTKPLIIPCLPKALTIQRNSYNMADGWEATFDAGDLPFDPTFIRAGSAELYLFQLTEVEQRIVDRRDPLSELDNAGDKPRDPVDTAMLEAANLAGAVGLEGLASDIRGRLSRDRFTYGNKPAIAGLIDLPRLSMSSDGRWVTLRGQDYTQHLMSLQWPPLPNGRARRIPTGKRIDELLGEILAEADPGGRLSVTLRGCDESDLPVVGEGEIRGNRRGIPVTGDTNYWEVMYKVATRHGFILYVDGLDVVLAKPRNLDADAAGRIKRLAWGANLVSLELERELGKEQSPTIVVRGYDPKTMEVVTVEYPEGEFHRAAKAGDKPGKTAATKASSSTSSKGKVTTTVRNRDEYQIVPAYGVTDRAQLRRMAETYYHLRGRAERRVVAVTHDLRDLRDSDMLTVTAGDACTIEWDDFNREVMANPQMNAGAKLDHLVARGFNTEVAQAIVDAYDRLQGLERPLRFKEGTITYDVESGVEIEFELADFIVINGIRPSAVDGIAQGVRGAVDRVRDKLRGADGKPLGWSAEREAAETRRRGAS
jgi:hypothetical protein